MTTIPCQVEVHNTHLLLRNLDPIAEEYVRAAFTWEDPKAAYMLRRHREKVHPKPMKWCYVCRDQGSKCLYQNHTLPIGFLPNLLALFDEYQVAYQVGDFRPPAPSRQHDWHYDRTLRPYQQDALEALLSNQYGVVEAATGAGKTAMAAALVCELGVPTLIVTPTKVVFQQFWSEFKDHTDCQLAQVASGQRDNGPVSISIAKSLLDEDGKPRLEHLMDKQLLILDEFHQSAAESWQKIVEACPAYYRFGFSATPFRATDLECNLLRGMAGNVIAKIGTEELQDQGFLCPTDIRVVTTKVAYDRRYQDEDGEWKEICFADRYRQGIVENLGRNLDIVVIVQFHYEQGEKVLVIVSWTDHADILLPYLPPDTIYLSGKDTPKKTEAKVAEYNGRSGGVLLGSPVVDVGFDAPAVDVVVMAGGGAYSGRQRQRLGRGLRPSPGKDVVIVYDFEDDDRGTGGRPTFYQHSQARLQAYRDVGQTTRYFSLKQPSLA